MSRKFLKMISRANNVYARLPRNVPYDGNVRLCMHEYRQNTILHAIHA